MDKKLVSIIIVMIAMCATAIFLVWGMLADSYQYAWIVYLPAGIGIVAVSMIGKYKRDKKKEDE